MCFQRRIQRVAQEVIAPSPFLTTTHVNSALHPSRVAKSSTSFGCGKGGKVTSAGWQVTLCDLIWHVISRSGVVISITNCYIRLTYFTLHVGLDSLNTERSEQLLNKHLSRPPTCHTASASDVDNAPLNPDKSSPLLISSSRTLRDRCCFSQSSLVTAPPPPPPLSFCGWEGREWWGSGSCRGRFLSGSRDKTMPMTNYARGNHHFLSVIFWSHLHSGVTNLHKYVADEYALAEWQSFTRMYTHLFCSSQRPSITFDNICEVMQTTL